MLKSLVSFGLAVVAIQAGAQASRGTLMMVPGSSNPPLPIFSGANRKTGTQA
jgi:hypothetical protein